MKIKLKKYPRKFLVGNKTTFYIKDMGKIYLEPDEQLTFITEKKKQYDVCRKNWGFYATPSINSRLKRENFKTAIVKNSLDRIYIMIIEKNHMSKFKKYCKDHKQKVLFWLDKYNKNNLLIKK